MTHVKILCILLLLLWRVAIQSKTIFREPFMLVTIYRTKSATKQYCLSTANPKIITLFCLWEYNSEVHTTSVSCKNLQMK